MSRWPRLAAAAAAAALAGIAAPEVRADGDPASDYLVNQNAYYPIQAPSPTAAARLQSAVDSVYEQGHRVKVALIYTATDLGAIPSLFGQPDAYSRFLGLELQSWYLGPLLIVMPSGFGIYDGGRPTQAEEQVLRSVPLSAASPDELTRSATTALQDLAAANALNSPDIRAPLVEVYPATATRGRRAILRFDLYDDSGHSKAVVRVYANHTLLATLTTPDRFATGTRHASVHWQVPAKLPSRKLHFCVTATDPSGNHSPPTCADFLRVS